MTNRIDQSISEAEKQADDAVALVKTMERHARRKRAERVFGPIVTEHVYPPIPIRNFDYHATFYNLVDLDMPNWARAGGATEAEALDTLLDQAEERYAEEHGEPPLTEAQKEARQNDGMYQAKLQRRAGC